MSNDRSPTKQNEAKQAESRVFKMERDGATVEVWANGAIKIEVGGSVHVRTPKEWHAAAVQSFRQPAHSGDMRSTSKREFFDRVVQELNLNTSDPFTLLLANALAVVEQRDELKKRLADAFAEITRLSGSAIPSERLNAPPQAETTGNGSVGVLGNAQPAGCAPSSTEEKLEDSSFFRPFSTADAVNKELAGWKDECRILQQDLARVRGELSARRARDSGEVWFWQGDGFDFPESLTCPVIVTADKLRALLALSSTADSSALMNTLRNMAATSWADRYEHRDTLTQAADEIGRLQRRVVQLEASRSALSATARACPYCTSDNPAIRSTYYDQTCDGCVKRMGQ